MSRTGLPSLTRIELFWPTRRPSLYGCSRGSRSSPKRRDRYRQRATRDAVSSLGPGVHLKGSDRRDLFFSVFRGQSSEAQLVQIKVSCCR